MSRSSLFSNARLKTLLTEAYSLPNIISIKKCSGLLNILFEIKCEDSSVFYAKCIDNKNVGQRDKLSYEIFFLSLYERNYTYPYLDFIIRTKKGSRLLYKDNYLITLRKKVPGRIESISSMDGSKRYSAGKMIGLFHSNIEDMHIKYPSTIWNKQMDIPLLYCMDGRQIQKFKKSIDVMVEGMDSVSADWWLDNTHIIDGFISKYFQMREGLHCKTQTIHGDLDATNITFQKDKAIGLFDWDFLQIAPRVLEVGSTLLNKPIFSKLQKPYEFNIQEVSEFVSGYNNGLSRKLSQTEISHIPFAFYNMGLQHLLTARLLFKLPKISDEKLTIFFKLKMDFMKVLEEMGPYWHEEIQN